MACSDFVILHIRRVEQILQYLLDRHVAASTLVVCSTKAAFLEAVQNEIAPLSSEVVPEQSTATQQAKQLWMIPTLRLLSTSRTVKLAFCPDITNLRAYLATYNIAITDREPESLTALRLTGAAPILAILDPLQLHRPTSTFSAQGLNRTFAIAVEAAHATSSKLVMAERPTALDANEDLRTDLNSPKDPWDEELPILNVTTKRLGEMSVGRTVKARTVAERWCTFEHLPYCEIL